ncbi:hypothetical protein vseg_011122 [Gypsophila vaccaria]
MAPLPPKIPHQNWPLPPPPPLSSSPPNQTTAPPMWADEFLDYSSARRGTHRRSMSDSVAFLDSPLVDACRSSFHHRSSGGGGFDRLDDEQLLSMFSNDHHMGTIHNNNNNNNMMDRTHTGVALGTPPLSSSPTSDQNSNNDNDNENDTADNVKSEAGEAESDMTNRNNNNTMCAIGPPSSANINNNDASDDIDLSHIDPANFDPRRVKRILANRQSAQRSRVRKLQYISELERGVTSLQTEVSTLSPRVAYLDHQRLILNVDNSALKQRIAALAQDKIFKDAHQEALKKEIERLRQLYHHQQQHNMKIMSNPTVQPPSSDHNMDCMETEQLMT